MRGFWDLQRTLRFSLLTAFFGFAFFKPPKHFEVSQVHFEDARSKLQFWHRESIARLFVIKDVVDKEDLCVAQSRGRHTELARTKTLKKNSAALQFGKGNT